MAMKDGQMMVLLGEVEDFPDLSRSMILGLTKSSTQTPKPN